MNDNTPILDAKSLYKSYTRPVRVDILKGVDLTARGGDSIAIMGRSGEGKSTLLQLLGTLEKPCRGSLTICGKGVNAFTVNSIRSHSIAFVFQSYCLLGDYSVLDNILMPARIARADCSPGSAAYRRAHELIDMVKLTGRAGFDTKLLSGGEKQRVAIARALCNDPSLILADEPSGNLDSETARLIHELLLGFAHDRNKALILVTHNEGLASMCKRSYTLKDGVLTEK